jgi:hypothetical protein
MMDYNFSQMEIFDEESCTVDIFDDKSCIVFIC